MPIAEVPPIDPLPYHELWLLERSIERQGSISLKYILADEEEMQWGSSADFNAPVFGDSPQQLATCLWALLQRGEISCRDNHQADLQLTVGDIEEWLRPTCRFYYGYQITPAGIARWERHAMPDWDRYIAHWNGIEGENRYFVGETIWSSVASTEATARRELQIDADDMAAHLVTIHWEGVRVERFAPFVAMPGKVLPQGVRVIVPVTNYGYGMNLEVWPPEFQDREFDALAWDEQLRDLNRWYANGTMNHPDRPMPRQNQQRS